MDGMRAGPAAALHSSAPHSAARRATQRSARVLSLSPRSRAGRDSPRSRTGRYTCLMAACSPMQLMCCPKVAPHVAPMPLPAPSPYAVALPPFSLALALHPTPRRHRLADHSCLLLSLVSSLTNPDRQRPPSTSRLTPNTSSSYSHHHHLLLLLLSPPPPPPPLDPSTQSLESPSHPGCLHPLHPV